MSCKKNGMNIFTNAKHPICVYPYAKKVISIPASNSSCGFSNLGFVQCCILFQPYSQWKRPWCACFILPVCIFFWHHWFFHDGNSHLLPETRFLSSTRVVCYYSKVGAYLLTVFCDRFFPVNDLLFHSLHKRPTALLTQLLHQTCLHQYIRKLHDWYGLNDFNINRGFRSNR